MTYAKAMQRIEAIGNVIPVSGKWGLGTSELIDKKEKAIDLIYKIADTYNAQEDRDNYIDITWADYDRAIYVNDLTIRLKEDEA